MSQSINSATKRGYDGTVARIAGNLLSGNKDLWLNCDEQTRVKIVTVAVHTARLIALCTKETEEPTPEEPTR